MHHAPINDVLPVGPIDAALAQHPFGDHHYITAQMHAAYRRRLAALAAQLPVAGALRGALEQAGPVCRYRVLGSTVLRCAVQHAQVRLETGEDYGLPLAQCVDVIDAMVHAVEEGHFAAGAAGAAYREADWVWDEARADGTLKQAFLAVLRLDYGHEQPTTPSVEEMAVLDQAVTLLDLLLPASARSALSHVHQVVVFPEAGVWRGRLSSSEFRLSGTIFLSQRLLANPWTTAEHLYHEALHQQFYDFRAAHRLLDPGFTRPNAPLIHSPWNRPDRTRNSYWDVHRALAAFHVYAHLALMCAAAEQSAAELAYGPMRLVGKRTALVRAHYLAEQLRGPAWQELGPAGQRLLDWFAALLEVLDTTPPAPGADAHLLLDRYWREALAVNAPHLAGHAQLRSCLSALIDSELDCARQACAAMGLDAHGFNNAVAQLPRGDAIAYFSTVRGLIGRTLLEACPASFRLSVSGSADDIVRSMVERSSALLMPYLDPEPGQDVAPAPDALEHAPCP